MKSTYKRKTYYATAQSDQDLATLKERYSQSTDSDVIRMILAKEVERLTQVKKRAK